MLKFHKNQTKDNNQSIQNQQQHGSQQNISKTGIPHNMKVGTEYAFRISLDKVRVHYNSEKATLANVPAYTEGFDIYIAPGQEHCLEDELAVLAKKLRSDNTEESKETKDTEQDTPPTEAPDTISPTPVAPIQTPMTEAPISTTEGVEQAETTQDSAPSLISPLFKQHQRLRTLAMLPDDRFVRGSDGPAVFAVQQALKQLYPTAELGTLGIYNPKTIDVVEKFQKEEGLNVDGELGQQSLLALDAYAFARIEVKKKEENAESEIAQAEEFEV